jgi:hypothetical protein
MQIISQNIVVGINSPTLIPNTSPPFHPKFSVFDPNFWANHNTGGHFFLKMAIEGKFTPD